MDKAYRANQDPYDLVTLPAAGTYVVSLDPLFDARFGIPRPVRLTRMPSFRNDVLDPLWW